jgi:hypothetical protein
MRETGCWEGPRQKLLYCSMLRVKAVHVIGAWVQGGVGGGGSIVRECSKPAHGFNEKAIGDDIGNDGGLTADVRHEPAVLRPAGGESALLNAMWGIEERVGTWDQIGQSEGPERRSMKRRMTLCTK